jgi:hypothetical protein
MNPIKKLNSSAGFTLPGQFPWPQYWTDYGEEYTRFDAI